MSAQWYYIDPAGTTLGPVEEKKLVELWCSNNLKPDSYVWNGTTVNEWKGISDVNFLYTKLKDAKNKRNAPAPRANPPRPAAAAPRPKKKKAGGGARMNLLDSIRSGKKLNKVAKKDLPQQSGPGGSGASRKPAGKMSLQDQLAMKLKKRTGGGPVKKKTTIPKKTSSGPTWREKQEAKKKAEGGEKKMTWSERQAAKKAAAASKSSSSGGSSGKAPSGKAPSKFQLKSKIDACNEDWILMAIDKLLS